MISIHQNFACHFEKSSSQTTHIFAPWKSNASLVDKESWHEIARPEIHGHDINCVASSKEREAIVSLAELMRKLPVCLKLLYLF